MGVIRRITYIFLCFAMVGVLSGCSVPKQVKVQVKGNKTVIVKKGQMLKLELEANATTGYMWELTIGPERDVLSEVGKYRYIHKSRRIGEGGIQQYRFKTLKKGKESLLFEYKRPWEKEKEAVKKFKVKVIVT